MHLLVVGGALRRVGGLTLLLVLRGALPGVLRVAHLQEGAGSRVQAQDEGRR